MNIIARRRIALILCFVLIISVFVPQTSVYAEKNRLAEIYHNDKKVTELKLEKSEKTDLEARHNIDGKVKYSWQVYADFGTESAWVSVSGQNSKSCTVTYSMLVNVLKKNKAKVRCQLEEGGIMTYSDPVTIRFEEKSKPQKNNIKKAEAPKTYAAAPGPDKSGEPEPAGTLTTHNIRIDYIYENGKTAAPSYIATIADGTPFYETVDSPQLVGYKPTREGGKNAYSVGLNYNSVTQDETITITYVAQNVSYLVLHLMQNIDNDNYTLFSTEKKTGKVGNLTDGLAMEHEGFYALPFENVEIAADGSTVVEIFYDRIYYLMTFKLSGGYGIEPLFARFGTSVDAKKPIRPGYKFTGWQKILKDADDEFLLTPDGLDYQVDPAIADLPATMPSEKTGYRAKWEKTNAGYTIVYWQENPDDDGYSFWGFKKASGIAGEDVHIGSDTKGAEGIDQNEMKNFVYNAPKSDKTINIRGDGSNVANVYFDRKLVTMTFFKEGGNEFVCGLPEHTHTFDSEEIIYYGGCYPQTGGKVPECGKEEHHHTDSCYGCGKEEHTHSLSCFSNVTETTASGETLDDLNYENPNPFNGYVAQASTYLDLGFIQIPQTEYHYLYLNGKWYQGNPSNQTPPKKTCGKEEHKHSDACGIVCGKEEHTHTYESKEVIRRGGCYDSEGNLTCTLQEHQHDSNCEKGTIIKSITRKYEADVTDIWNPYITGNDGTEYPNYMWIDTKKSEGNNQIYYNFLEKMPAENLIFKAKPPEGTVTYNINYYLELKDGESANGRPTRTSGGKTYVLYYVSTMQSGSGLRTTEEDYYDITGYVQRDDKQNPPSFPSWGNVRNADFYYDCAMPLLSVSSYGETVHSANHKYGSDISAFGAEPAYPSTLEEGAYRFGGWYTTADCIPGSEFSFENAKMPASNLSVYAKWEPRAFEVNFFTTAELTTRINDEPIIQKFGDRVQKMPIPPAPYPNVSFIGWFYDDDGIEKAIDFDEFRIKKNVNIYAKWSGATNVLYSVQYKIAAGQTDAGKIIAKPIQGYTKEGNNKTFEAKTGTALNDGYREGYYPLIGSHTVLMEGGKENNFVFEYMYREFTTYRVRYIDAETKQQLAPDKLVTDNKKAVVTENYKFIPKYVSDAFQKRLIVTADDNENVITFFYTKNEDGSLAPYTITHYLQEADFPDSYEAYQTFNMQGTVGQSRSTTVLSIEGYSFVKDKLKVYYYDSSGNYKELPYTFNGGNITITLPIEGAKIDILYDCQMYPYEVRHINDTDGTPIKAPEKGSARYGQVLTFNALSGNELPPAYEVYGLKSRDHRISIEESQTSAVNNIIEFYYLEKQIAYQYQVVMKPKEYSGKQYGYMTLEGEPVKVLTGNAKGTQIIVADPGFEFKGWYLDEECTRPVAGSPYEIYIDQNDGTKLCPVKEEAPDGEMLYRTDDVVNGQMKFYALLEPKIGDLTIKRENASPGDTFVYRVQGEGIDMEVSIAGNSSVTIDNLPSGSYTVTEEPAWSWRYAGSSQAVSIGGGSGDNTAVFGTPRSVFRWLSAFSARVVNRKVN